MNEFKKIQLKYLKHFKRHLGLFRYMYLYYLILIKNKAIIVNDQVVRN